MRHMTEAKDRVRQRPLNPTADGRQEWVAEVQAEMLRDHGLPPSEANLRLPQFSTTLPVEVYAAAVYAEAEFLQQPPKPLEQLLGEEPQALLEEHSELIQLLRAFRHGFLKPHADTANAQARLFDGGMFNGIPALVAAIDGILAKTRHSLASEVDRILAQLPGEQACLCRFLHIQKCQRNALLRASETASRALESAVRSVVGKARSFATEVGRLALSAHEIDAANIVVELLDSVSVYEEMAFLGDISDYDSLQPPLEPEFLLPLMKLQSEGTDGLKLRGRHVAHISRFFDHYAKFLYLAVVFANETYQSAKRANNNQPMQSIRDLERASRDIPVEEAVRITSLHFTQASLLVPILDLYGKVRCENPHAAVSLLDDIIDNEDGLSDLVRLRNTVFHVEKRKVNAEKRDNDVLRKVSSTKFLSDLTAGVEVFLAGVGRP